VPRVRGALLVAWTALLLIMPSALAAQTASPGAPPRVLNLVRVKLKPRSAGAYNALEAQIVRAYERAKAKVYWICLQGPRDASDVLYLNLHDSPEAAQRMESNYRDTIKQHPELTALQQRLTDLTLSTVSTMTTRRDDIDRAAAGVDFATLRTIRLTIFEVRPGREGEFLKAIRTTSAKEGSWLVYEANDSSTYALMTLKRTAIGRRDAATAVPRALRRARGVYTKVETHVYTVRPAMSHVSQAFVAANPQLWRQAATTH
jgi:hypothetical protein